MLGSFGLEGDEMLRREFITLVGGAIVELPLAALAQEPGRTYRLGCLSPHPRDIPFNVLFFDTLRRAGFIVGRNLTIDYCAYAAHIDLISQYAAELVIAQPDVIYAGGGVAIRADPQSRAHQIRLVPEAELAQAPASRPRRHDARDERRRRGAICRCAETGC